MIIILIWLEVWPDQGSPFVCEDVGLIAGLAVVALLSLISRTRYDVLVAFSASAISLKYLEL